MDDSEKSIVERNRDLNAHELAALFTAFSPESAGGPRYVDARLVDSWYERRASTGFPEPTKKRKPGVQRSRVWDVDVALGWFMLWVPKKGGAPRGNKNGLVHGGCVGLREEREKRAALRRGQSLPESKVA